MKLVVDSNIVFSALLDTNSLIASLLLDEHSPFDFCTVEYLIEEIEKHEDKILRHSKISLDEFEETKKQIYQNIKCYPEAVIPYEIWIKSLRWVRDVDMEDLAFVALSEFSDAPLWTGDKKLMLGLLSKGFGNCIATHEVVELEKSLKKSQQNNDDFKK